MTHYVVVAAFRIQPWLARTPKLVLIRGASRALHEATETSTVNRVLTETGLGGNGTRIAADAGDVDGIIVVETTSDQVVAVRRALREHVRRTLPGLEWTVWDGRRATVLDALTESKDDSELILAELVTVPFARRCEGCGVETAHCQQFIAGERLWIGPDCLSRWSNGTTSWLPGHAYRDELNIPGNRPPGTMEDLARARGRPAESANRYGGKRNHVAVVCADGNSVGETFKGISQHHRSKAVEALDRATRDALSTAAADITENGPGDTDVVVEPHFVGGDDILVSVPAPLAWLFALQLARRFEEHLRDYFAEKFESGGPVTASLGIGLCFSHTAYPFAHAREVAFAAMKEAKKGVQGSEAAVGWADLTAEDDVVPGRFRTVGRLAGLRAGYAQEGDLVIDLTNSSRAAIAAEIDEGGGRFQSPGRAVDRLAEYARRNSHDRLAAWLTSVQPADAVADLRAGISLARWWPQTVITTEIAVATTGTGPG